MSVGQNHFGFLPTLKTDKRREQKQLLRNKPEFSKITEQFSEIPSYFSELNASVPTSLEL